MGLILGVLLAATVCLGGVLSHLILIIRHPMPTRAKPQGYLMAILVSLLMFIHVIMLPIVLMMTIFLLDAEKGDNFRWN